MRRYLMPLLIVWAVLGIAYAQAPAAPANLDSAFKDAAVYKFGSSRECLTVISDAVRDSYGKADVRKDLVTKLVAIVESPQATLDAKDFACRQLSIAGGEEVVPAVTKLLGAKETANLARYALERIPGKASDDALLAALNGADPAVKVGIINSLGVRRTKAAAVPIAALMADANAQIAAAAMAAEAKIGGPDGAKALAGLKGKAPDALKNQWADACLVCADGLMADGQKDAAVAIYKEMSDKSQPDRIQVAAFRGCAKAAGDQAVPLVVEALQSKNLQLQRAATEFVRNLKAEGATAAFVGALPKLDPAGQVLMLAALGDRGDTAAFDAVNGMAKSSDASVRVAVLGTLGKIGNASCVPMLAAAASSDAKEEAVAARAALDSLRGKDVDPAIVAEMKKAAAGPRAELIKSLAARNAVSAVPALMETAKDADEKVREESFKAIGALASEKDLPALVALMAKAEGDGARREAEKATVIVAKTIPDASKRGAAVLAALSSTQDAPARASMYTVLAQVGDPNGLAPVKSAAATAANDAEKDAAVRAMANWPDVAALDDIFKLCGEAKNDAHRTLLIGGALRLMENAGDRLKDQLLAMYQKSMDLAKTPDEKKLVLSKLPNVKDVAALNIAKPCLAIDDLKQEAALAIQKIKVSAYKATASASPDQAVLALDNKNDTRWTSGANQAPGQWFQVDQGAEYEVNKVILDATNSPQDYPRGYQVFVSNDPNNWGSPVAEGKGTSAVTEIACKPTKGRYVKVVQTGTVDGNFWSIHELRIDSK